MMSSNPLKKVQINSPQKCIGDKLLHTVIKVKNPFFCHFFVDNLFRSSYFAIRNQHQILQTRTKRSKKRKQLSHKCVLELNFATKLLKLLYPNGDAPGNNIIQKQQT